jgi:putative aldouronate transport system permease protein
MREKASKTYRIFTCVNSIFMVLVIAICIFPFIHVLAKAINDGKDTALGGIYLWPRMPTLKNFEALLSRPYMYQAVLVSLARVLTGTSLSTLVIFMAAYSMNRKKFPGRSPIIAFLMLPMFFSGGIIPNYIMFARLGLLNNFLVYILPVAFNFFYMLLARTYMHSSIPLSLEESAKLDGANELLIFFRIFIPLCTPILATIILWEAVYHWNDWITTLYYAQTNSKIFTLQYQLMRMLRESEMIKELIEQNARRGMVTKVNLTITPESLKNAQTILTILPIVIVYPFLQNYFVKGVMIGAIKE